MGFLPKCCFDGFASPSTTKKPSTTIEDLCHRFSLPQLQQSTNNFDPSRKIGHDAFGSIFRGCISIDGQPKEIVVKRHIPSSEQGFSEFRNEILMLCQLHHPNLVSLVGFCDDQHEMIVVYEYMPNRSLDFHLCGWHSKSTKLSWKKRLKISIGAARGLHYLHVGTKRTIIHRGVKTSNILLDENWTPKLTDFGLSFKGPKYSSKAKIMEVDIIVGTTGYMAPEYGFKGKLTDKADVYCFGMVLLELICVKKSMRTYMIEKEESENKGDVNNVTYMIEKEESENEGDVNNVPHQSVEKGENEESEYDSKSEDASSSFVNVAKRVRNLAEKGNAGNIIDPSLVGEIAPECWKLFMDIAERCLSEDPDERPHMGEVEVQLERVLELQEEVNANQSCHHVLSS